MGFWHYAKETLYWSAVVAVILLFAPWWICVYIYRTVTGKNKFRNGFLSERQG